MASKPELHVVASNGDVREDHGLTVDYRNSLLKWELGTSTSLFPTLDQESFDTALRAGITRLELVVTGEQSIEPLSEIVDVAIKMGFGIHSVHLPYGRNFDPSEPETDKRQEVVARQARILDRVAEWGPKVAVIHPSGEPIADEERELRLKVCKDALARLAQAAAKVDIQLCVECLPRTCLGNNSDEILLLQDGIDELGVCCDVNHLFKETPEQFIRRMGERIKTVHISDNDGLDERHWAPGKGIIDWDAVLRALVEAGYNGPLVFEARSSRGEPPLDPQELKEWWGRMVRMN